MKSVCVCVCWAHKLSLSMWLLSFTIFVVCVIKLYALLHSNECLLIINLFSKQCDVCVQCLTVIGARKSAVCVFACERMTRIRRGSWRHSVDLLVLSFLTPSLLQCQYLSTVQQILH